LPLIVRLKVFFDIRGVMGEKEGGEKFKKFSCLKKILEKGEKNGRN